jgi:hypothetical protein
MFKMMITFLLFLVFGEKIILRDTPALLRWSSVSVLYSEERQKTKR